ncbi:class I SAM-dependent DNA methyltransferase [Anaerosporobacter faecicola]|uniref:class I SAM-dependent DNA methyltransferase n=1 Tax=Anaerosporobacter faecicola TaxID=2718714 RepID=UPI00143B0299|nr:class I SAM-dependent methyltransferase [Anaerosporobacter faecicola]
MQAYTGFAQVYDMFMDNIPYDDWCRYLTELLAEYGVKDGIVLDLGCGTGNVTERLSKKGYDMIGIDNAEEMLSIAMEKAMDQGDSILYLLQDMREFELYGTVSAVVSICDSMNYIMEEDDLREVFRLVNNYLDRQGIFIFDMNTEYKYETILANNTIAENRPNGSFIWDNYYYPEEKVNEYDLTIYVKEDFGEENETDLDDENEEEYEEDGEVFYRFDEKHYQKAYSLDTVKRLIEEAGMEFVNAFDAFTHDPVTPTSERIYIIAREKRQEHKYYTEE